MKYINNGRIKANIMSNRNDVLNLTFKDYLKVLFEEINIKVEYASRLQKAWVGWATLNIYYKLNKKVEYEWNN